jgi:hypothetical protein
MHFALNPQFSSFSIATLFLFVYTYLAFFANQLTMFWGLLVMCILLQQNIQVVFFFFLLSLIIFIHWEMNHVWFDSCHVTWCLWGFIFFFPLLSLYCYDSVFVLEIFSFNSDMNQHSYVHLLFDEGFKNVWWSKDSPLQQMLLGKLDICIQKTETRSMSFTLYK